MLFFNIDPKPKNTEKLPAMIPLKVLKYHLLFNWFSLISRYSGFFQHLLAVLILNLSQHKFQNLPEFSSFYKT